jgi:hypothetical protein
VDRFAIAAASEVRFPDSAPKSTHPENREHMIGVAVRFEIEN